MAPRYTSFDKLRLQLAIQNIRHKIAIADTNISRIYGRLFRPKSMIFTVIDANCRLNYIKTHLAVIIDDIEKILPLFANTEQADFETGNEMLDIFLEEHD